MNIPKKFIIIIAIFVFILLNILKIVYALDSQIYQSCGGDEKLIIGCLGDDQLLFVPPEPTILGDGSSGGARKLIFYDLIVEAFDTKQGGVAKATIDLKNKGDLPDRDLKLTYYITNNKTVFGKNEQTIFEVPIGDNIVEKSINLPLDIETGEWRFVVTIDQIDQPPITAYDSFQIKSVGFDALFFILVIIGSVLVVGFLLWLDSRRNSSFIRQIIFRKT